MIVRNLGEEERVCHLRDMKRVCGGIAQGN